MRSLIKTCLALLLAVLAGFGTGMGAAQAQDRGPLVLAASSLQEALTDAANAWAAGRHARPIVSFAASSALARQVEAGARADLFISADAELLDYLAEKALIRPETRAVLASNRLVLIAPAGSRTRLAIARNFPLARAMGQGRLAMADPEAVPAGRYGKAALEHLGVWNAVSGKVARAENVRAALALVERGAAPFGVVYATDARASARVRVLGTFPSASHPPIVYPLARLKASSHPDAEGFRRFLLSRQGRAILARRGFAVR